MIYAIIAGILFGICPLLLKFYITLSFPAIMYNVFSYAFIACSVVGFFSFQINMREMGSSITNAIVTSISTILPVIIAILLFQEIFSIIEAIGIVFIVAAILLVLFKK